jgi:hypothetical protein
MSAPLGTMEMKMSDVIDFLERLGGDATLRRVPLATALDGVGTVGLSAEVRAALANRDQHSLEALLGVGNVCCLVNAPVEQEKTDAPVKKDAARAA